MVILAIDPGFGRCGVALLTGSGSKPELLYSSCIETSAKLSFSDRILEVGNGIKQLIDLHRPDLIALEELFFTNNAKTALHVAEVRGMIMYIAATSKIPLVEYNPLAVKIALTGYGRATKEQVTKMVEKMLHIEEKKMLDDEFDAIALGITTLAHSRHEQARM